MLVDSQEEPSLRELDAAIDGAHDLREDNSLPSISHLENKGQPTFAKSLGGCLQSWILFVNHLNSCSCS